MNGELSTVALPLKPGNSVRIYVAGDGVDQIARSGIATTSQFMTVDPETLITEEFDIPYAVISFEVSVARNTPAVEYSIVLKSSDGEMVYLVGALTVER